MREIRTCDFCGDEAAGTFEVVPPGVDPDGDGRRMVLCTGCRDTVASVVEPLLGREGCGEVEIAPGEETGTTTVVAEPGREPDHQPEKGTNADSPGGSGSEPGMGADPASDGAAPPSGGGTGAATDGDESLGDALSDGNTGKSGGRPRSARRGTPRGYRKVMRFLENREFPLDREEAETLAAEAYAMDPEAVSAAVDHAIKHNRLREVSGELRQ